MAEVNTRFVNTEYGKNFVRLLHVRREGRTHHVREIEVSTKLTLDSKKDFINADNSDIVATDSQKNTVYVLAKQIGVKSIEAFALELSKHFLRQYSHVNRAQIRVEQAPWKRVDADGRPHNHAFINTQDGTRYCSVDHRRHEDPVVCGGIKDLKVLKTTQSAFTNFVQDDYRTLPDADDRIFCTIIRADWKYDRSSGFDFDRAWETVREAIMQKFAGPPDVGIYSPSVQNTIYLAIRLAMSRVEQISEMSMELPNVHAYTFDFTKFPAFKHYQNQNEVFQVTDTPCGVIKAFMAKTPDSSL